MNFNTTDQTPQPTTPEAPPSTSGGWRRVAVKIAGVAAGALAGNLGGAAMLTILEATFFPAIAIAPFMILGMLLGAGCGFAYASRPNAENKLGRLCLIAFVLVAVIAWFLQQPSRSTPEERTSQAQE